MNAIKLVKHAKQKQNAQVAMTPMVSLMVFVMKNALVHSTKKIIFAFLVTSITANSVILVINALNALIISFSSINQPAFWNVLLGIKELEQITTHLAILAQEMSVIHAIRIVNFAMEHQRLIALHVTPQRCILIGLALVNVPMICSYKMVFACFAQLNAKLAILSLIVTLAILAIFLIQIINAYLVFLIVMGLA